MVGLSTYFSDCGSFINVQRDPSLECTRTIIWYLPNSSDAKGCRHLRSELSHGCAPALPRSLQPLQLIHSTFWGSETTYLQIRCAKGRFHMNVHDPQYPSSAFMEVMLPTYLPTATPTVILGDKNALTSIKLVFLCKDRRPEIMVLPFTWDSLIGMIQMSHRSQPAVTTQGHNEPPTKQSLHCMPTPKRN